MSQVLFEINDGVAIATTSNPPAELFDSGQISGLREAIRAATAQNARAMIIKSDASLFSGGADVATIFHGRSREEGRALLSEGMEMIAELEDAPFPVIAAINGLCFAAGLEVALACDFIYAADDAVFAQVEALIGVTTLLGGVYRLAERCGPAIAREIVYTADMYSADQFAQWHIVNRVVPAAELHESALAVARSIASGPAKAHVQTKRLVRHALSHDARAADRVVLDEATALYDSEDMHHAVAYLVEHGARSFRANHHLIKFEGR